MMVRTILCAAVMAVVLTLTAFAGPNPRNDFDICEKASGDIAIAACDRAIASGKFTGRELAALYTNRGVEWRAKGNLDRAIADYTEAIRIDPTFAGAYYARGNA